MTRERRHLRKEPRDHTEWNRLYPVGTPVRVRLPKCETLETVTRSAAYECSLGPLILVEGLDDLHHLGRVDPVAPAGGGGQS